MNRPVNALSERDALFSQLHVSALKSAGFRKRGHWVTRTEADTIQSIYLRASRFGSSDEAIFWIDIQVFHAGWCDLVFGRGSFTGLKEGNPSLVAEDLGKLCEPPLSTLVIDNAASVASLTETLQAALLERALPLLTKCSTLDGVLNYYLARNNPRADALAAAGICLLLGRQADAQKHMQAAKQHAPHANSLQWLLKREETMWSNFSG
jgi:hypothetical protein